MGVGVMGVGVMGVGVMGAIATLIRSMGNDMNKIFFWFWKIMNDNIE